ncbi:uncharacterized protein YjbI with pentapeptide repeats [Rhizomicrobium palustre]|uniref:Uncharacterized protein YjbI with pentapeptide repeats n=1 Tax=Rhizomicrobium palustre TaxID=189966 RepID=A0A846MZL3_9PROT|nr:hypothetical protein [Rhizomicrobium palustre]NIK88689.1 uncharacterized protein YjbI with pentapeptide repeats [Rhizomicrobium palustre]
MGERAYSALAPIEQSLVDALTAGAVWSPEYFSSWCQAHQEIVCNPKVVDGRIQLPARCIRKFISQEDTPLPGGNVVVDATGARFCGVNVEGDLNLTALKFLKPIQFDQCVFSGEVLLTDANLGHVSFTNCNLQRPITAVSVKINSEFVLTKSVCPSLRFESAKIAGSVQLDGSVFDGAFSGDAWRTLDFSDATIGSYISLRKVEVTGEVRIVGAKIEVSIFCQGARLRAHPCHHRPGRAPEDARALYGGFAAIGGGVYLSRGFHAEGQVSFVGAKIGSGVHAEYSYFEGTVNFAVASIGGSLFFECATLNGVPMVESPQAGPRALYCWNTTVGANVFLAGLKVTGEVDFNLAKIGASFRAEQSSFSNAKYKALNCTNVTVGVSVILDRINAIGPVDFCLAEIGGRFVGSGSRFDHAGSQATTRRRALNCDSIRVGGSVVLDGGPRSKAVEMAAKKLESCRIRGDELGDAVGVPAGTPIFVQGVAYFYGATIGGDFDCRGGRFVNLDGASLVCSSATIGGNVYLSHDFVGIGEVYLRGVTITGNLHCRGGSFHDGITKEARKRSDKIRDAIDLEGARIAKALYLTGIHRFRGSLDLHDAYAATYADDSSVWNANWHATAEAAEKKARGKERPNSVSRAGHRRRVPLSKAVIPDDDSWKPLAEELEIELSVLEPDYERPIALPKNGKFSNRRGFSYIQLDRFTYGAFADDDRFSDHDGEPEDEEGANTDLDFEARYALLLRQEKKQLTTDFRPQPFTHCARVLRSMGRARDARKILNRRERHWLQHKSINWLEYWFRRIFFGFTCGYGYNKRLALWWLAGIWLFSSWLYAIEGDMGLMRSSSDVILVSDYYNKHNNVPNGVEPYQPAIYALDVLLPIIDLGQKHEWVPADGYREREAAKDSPLPNTKQTARQGVSPTSPKLQGENIPGFERILNRIGPHPIRLDIIVSWFPKAWYWTEMLLGWLFTTIIVAGLTGLIGHQRQE